VKIEYSREEVGQIVKAYTMNMIEKADVSGMEVTATGNGYGGVEIALVKPEPQGETPEPGGGAE